jgi:hypothetical protein
LKQDKTIILRASRNGEMVKNPIGYAFEMAYIEIGGLQ